MQRRWVAFQELPDVKQFMRGIRVYSVSIVPQNSAHPEIALLYQPRTTRPSFSPNKTGFQLISS